MKNLLDYNVYNHTGNKVDLSDRTYFTETLSQLSLHQNCLLKCSRQVGTTTMLLIYATLFAEENDNSNIIIYGFKNEYNKHRLVGMYTSPFKQTKHSITIGNNSTIFFGSSDVPDNVSIDLAIYDNIDYNKSNRLQPAKRYIASCGNYWSNVLTLFMENVHPLITIKLPYTVLDNFDESRINELKLLLGEEEFNFEYVV